MKRGALLVATMLVWIAPACAHEEEPVMIDPYHCWDSIEHMWKDCDWSSEVRARAIRDGTSHYKVLGRDGKYHEVWIDAKRRQAR